MLALRPVRTAVGRWLFGGVFVFGVSIVVFALSSSFWLSLVSLGVLGASDMVSMYVRHLLVQLQTPDVIRGRVSAVNAVFIGASNELGEFESGVGRLLWGIVPAALVGGGRPWWSAWSGRASSRCSGSWSASRTSQPHRADDVGR